MMSVTYNLYNTITNTIIAIDLIIIIIIVNISIDIITIVLYNLGYLLWARCMISANLMVYSMNILT